MASFISGMVEWSKQVFLPLGPAGLFIVSFMESSFFPIPPDLLLIPLCLAAPELSIFYAAIAVAGSVAGAFLGYWIGLKGGRPLLLRITSKKNVERVDNYFKKYGTWAVGIAGFTPIPYKIFTIASGVCRHSVAKLFAASVMGRSGRFFLEAIIIMLWGSEIISFIDRYFGILTIMLTLAVVAAYAFYTKMKKK